LVSGEGDVVGLGGCFFFHRTNIRRCYVVAKCRGELFTKVFIEMFTSVRAVLVISILICIIIFPTPRARYCLICFFGGILFPPKCDEK
jgi:hypothetical protein